MQPRDEFVVGCAWHRRRAQNKLHNCCITEINYDKDTVLVKFFQNGRLLNEEYLYGIPEFIKEFRHGYRSEEVLSQA